MAYNAGVFHVKKWRIVATIKLASSARHSWQAEETRQSRQAAWRREDNGISLRRAARLRTAAARASARLRIA